MNNISGIPPLVKQWLYTGDHGITPAEPCTRPTALDNWLSTTNVEKASLDLAVLKHAPVSDTAYAAALERILPKLGNTAFIQLVNGYQTKVKFDPVGILKLCYVIEKFSSWTRANRKFVEYCYQTAGTDLAKGLSTAGPHKWAMPYGKWTHQRAIMTVHPKVQSNSKPGWVVQWLLGKADPESPNAQDSLLAYDKVQGPLKAVLRVSLMARYGIPMEALPEWKRHSSKLWALALTSGILKVEDILSNLAAAREIVNELDDGIGPELSMTCDDIVRCLRKMPQEAEVFRAFSEIIRTVNIPGGPSIRDTQVIIGPSTDWRSRLGLLLWFVVTDSYQKMVTIRRADTGLKVKWLSPNEIDYTGIRVGFRMDETLREVQDSDLKAINRALRKLSAPCKLTIVLGDIEGQLHSNAGRIVALAAPKVENPSLRLESLTENNFRILAAVCCQLF